MRSAGSGPSCPACACNAGLSCVQGTPIAATPPGRASASPMPLLVVSLSPQLEAALMLCCTVRGVEPVVIHQRAWLESICQCDVQQHTDCDMDRGNCSCPQSHQPPTVFSEIATSSKCLCCDSRSSNSTFSAIVNAGGGTCAFLLLTMTKVLLMSASRACLSPSPYLDDHGEEDVNLTRGRYANTHSCCLQLYDI